ncbi:MAG: Sec-independent protein translocase protein TatB [Pseudomonadales bacterium]|nr:Sec-independent protein translocase protein TatB [Pseudomonadales bacterium]
MFDIGFFELLLIGVVGLLVLGPERLPGTIRTIALWIGRLRRSFNNIKMDIEKEIGADEIRRQLRNEDIMEKFKHTRSQFTEMTDSVKKDLDLKQELAGLADGAANKAVGGTDDTADGSAQSELPFASPDPGTGSSTPASISSVTAPAGEPEPRPESMPSPAVQPSATEKK